jgi:hypothetical protein
MSTHAAAFGSVAILINENADVARQQVNGVAGFQCQFGKARVIEFSGDMANITFYGVFVFRVSALFQLLGRKVQMTEAPV